MRGELMIDAGDGRVFLLGLTMVRTGEHDERRRRKREEERERTRALHLLDTFPT
jgi:hypothetical protein